VIERAEERTDPPNGRQWWPPVAEAAGVDLPAPLVLLLFLGIELVWLLSARVILPDGWTRWVNTGSPIDALVQTVPWVVHAVAALAVVGLLRWHRGVGLVGMPRNWLSPWGVVPIAAFVGVAILDATRLPGWVLPGALLGAMVLNYSTSAFVEELVYRGFLVHGLTRRLGGTLAVLTSALLSALVHFVPSGRTITLRPFLFFFCFAILMSAIRSATGSIWYPAVAHAAFDVFTAIDTWLYRLDDRWPPGAFVYRVTFVLGLFLLLALALKALGRLVERLETRMPPPVSTQLGGDEGTRVSRS
jgi:membrane protease YdiL (CAAX protease family)